MLRDSRHRRELARLLMDLLFVAIAIAALSLLTTAGAFAALGQWLAEKIRF